jgi:hypothetical protein
LDPSIGDRNPEDVAGRIGRIPAGVDAVLENVRVARPIESEPEVDVSVGGVVVSVTQASHPHRIELADSEFDVAVTAQLFLRGRPGVLTSVATGCLLHPGFRDSRVDEIGPRDGCLRT